MSVQAGASSEPVARAPERAAGRRVSLGRLAGLASTAVLATLLLVYVGLSTIVADRLSRPERHPLAGTPAEHGLAFEAGEFASPLDGARLRSWWLPAPGSDRAIVVVHGRNSNRTARDGALLRQTAALAGAGYNVFTYDGRAHGESGGDRYSLGPLEQWDVAGAVAQVRRRGIQPGKIFLLGHSMGAATALLAAPRLPEVAGVIADSPYARLTDLLGVELPRASGLPALFNPGILFMGNALWGIDLHAAAPEESIRRVPPRPILFIHSETDELIPVEHSRRLWRLSGEVPGRLWTVAGPKHDQVYSALPEEYLRRVTAFLEETGS